MIDNVLLKKAKQGNISAFEAIVLQYENYIYNISYRMLYNSEDAKDVSQEILIKIYKNINKCNDVQSLKAWIGKIATNTCIDELRKRRGKKMLSLDSEIETEEGSMEREQVSDTINPDEALLHKEAMGDIQMALNTLSQDYKTLIVMRDIYGYSYNEMSEITGINLGTVKSRLNRARTSLRGILKRQDEIVAGTKNE